MGAGGAGFVPEPTAADVVSVGEGRPAFVAAGDAGADEASDAPGSGFSRKVGTYADAAGAKGSDREGPEEGAGTVTGAAATFPRTVPHLIDRFAQLGDAFRRPWRRTLGKAPGPA